MATAKQMGPLTAAAAAFDDELARYDELSQELAKAPIQSQKNLERGKRAMEECAECERRLQERLAGLLEAMRGSQARQQGCMEVTLAAAKRMQTRVNEFADLMGHFAELGVRARELHAPVVAVIEQHAGGPTEELTRGLAEVAAKMGEIADEAEAIAAEARAGSWTDIARDADMLRQQVQATRNKVLLAQKNREKSGSVASA